MYRNLITKYAGACADCGAELPAGTKARYYGRGRLYGVDCHEDTAKTSTAPPILAALTEAAAAAGSAYANYAAEHYTEPVFAVVENAPGDIFHNPAAPTRTVGTMFDVCGFVWVDVDNRRKNGAPGARMLREFKSHAAEDHIGTWRLGEFSLSHSGYDGSWHLGGYGADSVTGGTGNCAMSAAEAGAGAFVASMAAAGYDGLRVESRID